jgi:hypothetical protein
MTRSMYSMGISPPALEASMMASVERLIAPFRRPAPGRLPPQDIGASFT